MSSEAPLIAGLIVLAALARFTGRHEVTGDMRAFYRWYADLTSEGVWHGLGEEIGNYNAPFLYLLALTRPVARASNPEPFSSCVGRVLYDRLTTLGFGAFNISLGESMALEFDEWVSPEEMADYVLSLPHEANAGDIYCLS